MKVLAEHLDYPITQAEVDAKVNALLLNFETFSNIANADCRLQGVITNCDTCRYTVTSQLQRSIIRDLFDKNAYLERTLQMPLTASYKVVNFVLETAPYMFVEIPNGCVSKVGVGLQTRSLGSFPVSYAVETNTAYIDSGNGYTIVQVNRHTAANPDKMIFRDISGKEISRETVHGFPRRIGDTWEIALMLPYADTHTIDTYTCYEAYVDIEPSFEEGETIDMLYPVYQNTDQKIPVKRREQINDTTYRYVLSVGSLIDDPFIGEVVNLQAGEYYKLMPSIEFRVFSEVNRPLTVRYQREDFTTTEAIEITKFLLVDKQHGHVRVELPPVPNTCQDPVRMILDIPCYVDPNVHSNRNLPSAMQYGLAHLVAAELPLEICDCNIKEGFIAICQKPFTDVRINPITGESFIQMRHGNLYGQLVFQETLHRLYKQQKVILL